MTDLAMTTTTGTPCPNTTRLPDHQRRAVIRCGDIQHHTPPCTALYPGCTPPTWLAWNWPEENPTP